MPVIPEGAAGVSHFFRCDGGSRDAAVTYGVLVDTGDDPTATASALANLFVTNVVGGLNSHVTQTFTRVTIGTPGGPIIAEHTDNVVGGDGGNGASINVAYLVKKNTDLGGRKNRGRLYLPGVSEANIDVAGNIDATFAADFQDNLDAWLAALAAAELPMVILHTDPADTLLPAVTSLRLESMGATQRRRLVR